ncbi:MAG: hypothetical protein OXH76_20635 [Boseongicola sp.]|nr:hypothetical protein [Boseongicola sp.]
MLAPTAGVLATGRGKNDKSLHWMLQVAETGLDTSCTVLRRYELRWRIGRISHAFKIGTRFGHCRLDEYDLAYCMASSPWSPRPPSPR